MKGIIKSYEREVLQYRVKQLCENDGIYNQICHLASPDDNEDFQSVFYYLEDHILGNIEGWTQLLKQLHMIKRKLF